MWHGGSLQDAATVAALQKELEDARALIASLKLKDDAAVTPNASTKPGTPASAPRGGKMVAAGKAKATPKSAAAPDQLEDCFHLK